MVVYAITLITAAMFFVNMPISLSASGEATNIVEYVASPELIQWCDSLRSVEECPSMTSEVIGEEYLRLLDSATLSINSDSTLVLIVACRGKGEIILVEPKNNRVVTERCAINIPGRHAVLDEVQDINNDNNDEIRINLSAGAHGLYSYFVSAFPDSLSLIRTKTGNYDFFALRGGIVLKDTDGDGTLEILVDSSADQEQKRDYLIYRWDGRCYAKATKVER